MSSSTKVLPLKETDDTAAPLHKTHTIRLHFDDTPEDIRRSMPR
jgi:hypothetical protein